jgi:hypothetical protein
VIAFNMANRNATGLRRGPIISTAIGFVPSLLLGATERTEKVSAGAAEANRVVAQFRATYDPGAGDPAFVELMARLFAQASFQPMTILT